MEIDKNILESLLKIPKGQVTTYKILADKFWVHSRRIASVMKMNKDPDIYPCYKVISHSRKISGYSWPDGVKSKITMLKNDGIIVENDKIAENYLYYF
jgi:O6-methylguanine-DNA--protein-cysteine methyltransferase